MALMDAVWLAGFSEDVAFAHHSVTAPSPPTFPPCRSASGIHYASKQLSKLVDNSASYLLNSW